MLIVHAHIFTAQCTLVQSAVLRSHVVRPSVTLVDCDHISFKSWKLIARTIIPTPSLFVAKRRSIYSQGNMGEFGETRGGVGKEACWRTKVTISLKRVKKKEKLLWTAYRNSQTLFRTVPSPTPYGLPFPQNWGFVIVTPIENCNLKFRANEC